MEYVDKTTSLSSQVIMSLSFSLLLHNEANSYFKKFFFHILIIIDTKHLCLLISVDSLLKYIWIDQ